MSSKVQKAKAQRIRTSGCHLTAPWTPNRGHVGNAWPVLQVQAGQAAQPEIQVVKAMMRFFVALNTCTAVMLVLAVVALPTHASDDAARIRAEINTQFDKPGYPVDPIVVVDGYAVAGWTQERRGGRAPLRRSGDAWRITLCAGDALKRASGLRQTGMPAATARELETKLATVEATLPSDRLSLLSSFEGIMEMPADDVPHRGIVE